MFGRNAEPEGLDFYSGLLVNGQLSLAQIAQSILNGAQSLDRQVAEGRVKAATAFTQELDTPEENAAYGTSRGIEIGKAYLQQVTASNGVVPVLGKVVETVATLLPTTPAPTPGGGSGGGAAPAPAPTFEVKVDSGVLSFGGTQTGDIIVTEGHLEVIFTRGALSQTLSAADYVTVTDVSIGSASVTTPAIAINGLIVTGTGSLVLLGVDDSLDLSGIASSLNVTARVDADLDLTRAPNLSTVDTLVLNTGAILTLSAAQFDAVTISGSGDYVLQDGATALLSLGNADLLGAAQVVVTGEPTIAQLKALTDAGAAPSYDTVYDTADALKDEVTNGVLITSTTNVVVTDPIAVAVLAHLKSDVSAGGTVFAKNLQDDIDNLIPGGNVHTYVIQGTNITVGDNATVEQIQALDAKNGEGNLTYSLQDTLANLRKADVALLSGAGTIVLSSLTLGSVKVADVQWLRDLLLDPLDSAYPLDPDKPPVIEGPSGNPITLADLIFTLKDTYSSLVSNASDTAAIVAQAGTVEASDTVSVSQAVTLHAREGAAIYSIADSASNLSNASGASNIAIGDARHVTATTVANAFQAEAILTSAGGNADKVTYDVADTHANLMANVAGANAAHNLTVNWNGYLPVAQAAQIIALTNDGHTSIPHIRDTASAINGFVAGNPENDDLSYSFWVYDTAGNIIEQITAGNLYFATGNADGVERDHRVEMIEVTGAFNVADAQTFWNAINTVFDGVAATTAGKTFYVVTDTLASYTNAAAAHEGIIHADGRTINAATAAEVYAAQTTANDNRDIFSVLAGEHGTSRDSLNIAAGSAGHQNIQGTKGNDVLRGGDDNDTLNGGAGNDTLYGDNGNDTINGGAGDDTIYGGSGWDALYGGDGRDTIYADGGSGAPTSGSASNQHVNSIYGGNGGDNLFGSSERDTFIFTGNTREALIAESGTHSSTRDYITHFSQGDTIHFQNVHAHQIQFVGTGSSNNASPVAAGALGLSISYEKGVQAQNWAGTGTIEATLVKIDIANANGHFDNNAEMHIVLVGNIDINMLGNTITFGA